MEQELPKILEKTESNDDSRSVSICQHSDYYSYGQESGSCCPNQLESKNFDDNQGDLFDQLLKKSQFLEDNIEKENPIKWTSQIMKKKSYGKSSLKRNLPQHLFLRLKKVVSTNKEWNQKYKRFQRNSKRKKKNLQNLNLFLNSQKNQQGSGQTLKQAFRQQIRFDQLLNSRAQHKIQQLIGIKVYALRLMSQELGARIQYQQN